MRTFKTLPLVVIIASLSCVMCTEDTPDLSEIALFVTPGKDSSLVISSGDKTSYLLEISTINNRIENFSISSFDAQYGEQRLFDSICSNNKISYRFIYHAPEINRDSLNVELKFHAKDNNGNVVDITRIATIKNRYVSSDEYNGLVLYNTGSGMPDALSFSDISQTFILTESPDSLKADIYVVADSDFLNIAWKSKTNTKFIRNNTFNYATATAGSINAVYQNSVRNDVIRNIQINDIILVGHDNMADGVFFVRNIIRDNNTPGNSCLQLSFKGVLK